MTITIEHDKRRSELVKKLSYDKAISALTTHPDSFVENLNSGNILTIVNGDIVEYDFELKRCMKHRRFYGENEKWSFCNTHIKEVDSEISQVICEFAIKQSHNIVQTLYVHTYTFCERNEEETGEGQYDYQWSEYHDFQINKVSLKKPNGYDHETFEVGFSVKSGEAVEVLSCRYGDGDSFGHSSGKGEILWIFSNKNKALVAKERFEQSVDNHYVRIISDRDEVAIIVHPAYGYFENLEGVHLDAFIVE